MLQLLPSYLDDVDLVTEYLSDVREPVGNRPWLAINMASTADGATTLEGRSGGIGSDADHAAFHALRSAADIVLAGAGTARAENYGPVRIPGAHQAARRAAGRDEPARVAVVTASCALDPDARLFSDPSRRPLIYTVTDAPSERVNALADVAEVVRAGSGQVDPELMLADMAERGARCVVCEGGPSLNGHLISAEVVDEWCLTIGPLLAGGQSARVAHGPPIPTALPFRLDRLLHDGRDLLARYVAERSV